MSEPRYGSPSSGERWNVNMPVVVGVVFVLLIGVVVWVIATGGDGEGDGAGEVGGSAVDETPVPTDSASGGGVTTAATAPAASSATTTPAPMPATTAPGDSSTTTAPATTVPTTTMPATTAPGAPPGAVPGDLAIPGRPMQRPNCDGAFITLLASAVGDNATADGIADLLDRYPGANYLRTDQTCPSLTPNIDGAPIYVVYFGPFAVASDACAARADGPDGAYVRQLSTELGSDHAVACV